MGWKQCSPLLCNRVRTPLYCEGVSSFLSKVSFTSRNNSSLICSQWVILKSEIIPSSPGDLFGFKTKLIHSDQKGFVNGRNISEANRLIQDVIAYTDREDDDGIIIFLDQQKAFDRVEPLYCEGVSSFFFESIIYKQKEFVFDLFPVSYIKLRIKSCFTKINTFGPEGICKRS
jgi:hypothetical protein